MKKLYLHNVWARWKRYWRRLENAPAVLIFKRRTRQLLGTELRHFVEVRRPTVRAGGWTVCTTGLTPGGIAYCFGVGEDVTLELALIDLIGLEVHAFDPTPRAVEWLGHQVVPAGFHHHPIGVAGSDGTASFAPSDSPTNPSFTLLERSGGPTDLVECEVRKLSSLAKLYGHRQLHLLKLDVEGAEYQAIDDLLESGLEVKQILVEFHHRFRNVGRAQTGRAVKQLYDAGYRIFYISPSGREYSFILEP